MNEMIVRVAQAIRFCLIPETIPGHRIPWEDVHPDNQERLINAARVVVEEMREPTVAMTTAGLLAAPLDTVAGGEPYKRADTGQVVWRAMIDAAVAEGATDA